MAAGAVSRSDFALQLLARHGSAAEGVGGATSSRSLRLTGQQAGKCRWPVSAPYLVASIGQRSGTSARTGLHWPSLALAASLCNGCLAGAPARHGSDYWGTARPPMYRPRREYWTCYWRRLRQGQPHFRGPWTLARTTRQLRVFGLGSVVVRRAMVASLRRCGQSRRLRLVRSGYVRSG